MSNNRPLQRMFMAVPPRYDFINSIFTLGMDKKWRNRATAKCLSHHPGKFLDICCGTGDLAIDVAKTANTDISIIGIDYSQPMLERAAKKAKTNSAAGNFSLVQGDASALPLADESVDCVGISFAFRNMTYKNPLAQKHLSEVFRILRKGGRYVIVESSQPECSLIRVFFRFYLRTFVFWAGYLISGNKGAYRYLTGSAADFYTPAQVKNMLMNVGFNEVEYQPLFFGAAGLHVASKSE